VRVHERVRPIRLIPLGAGDGLVHPPVVGLSSNL
jgi:hypothetical protein